MSTEPEKSISESEEVKFSKEKKFNIQETAAVQSTATTQESEKVEEKGGNVSIKLVEIGEKKLQIWKEIVIIVEEIKKEKISPIKAKGLTEKEDKIILEDVARDKVEGEKGIKKRLEALGAKVEIVLIVHLFFKAYPNKIIDYNNDVRIEVKDMECREPETVVEDSKGKKKIRPQSEAEARANSLT
ncbi:14810_t:CDS:2 [Funneliformis caledonium]|uniref:14810_t:CDS:1 n=1 Tax=Funneliformis caledonium TaxID=1117310 RepID=A0A9N9ISH8_9GLOM|nr:14810_t:CDS:2 [Funneliformis caledonium]